MIHRWVDRDMFMRYRGGGIGHFSQRASGNEGNTHSDIDVDMDVDSDHEGTVQSVKTCLCLISDTSKKTWRNRKRTTIHKAPVQERTWTSTLMPNLKVNLKGLELQATDLPDFIQMRTVMTSRIQMMKVVGRVPVAVREDLGVIWALKTQMKRRVGMTMATPPYECKL
jgi:hypothetical protein